jgi:hypothetical protein
MIAKFDIPLVLALKRNGLFLLHDEKPRDPTLRSRAQ